MSQHSGMRLRIGKVSLHRSGQQILPCRKVPVERSVANSGLHRDAVQGRKYTFGCKNVARGAQDRIPIAACIGTERAL